LTITHWASKRSLNPPSISAERFVRSILKYQPNELLAEIYDGYISKIIPIGGVLLLPLTGISLANIISPVPRLKDRLISALENSLGFLGSVA